MLTRLAEFDQEQNLEMRVSHSLFHLGITAAIGVTSTI